MKIHVHTKVPGQAIAYAQQWGEFITFKMENMSIQHNEVLLKELEESEPKKKAPRVKAAIVAVAPSLEIKELFEQMGVNKVIIGGQTMNPSAEDFVKAFEEVNADSILVFPNNGNVILTAQQAGNLFQESKVFVVESKSPIQAYSALGMVNLVDQTIEDNLDIINEAIANVVAAEISPAVRDSVNNGIEIKQGEFIGISQGAVRCSKPDLIETAKCLLDQIIQEKGDISVITVFYGSDVNEEQKNAFREIASSYDMVDLMEIDANQSIYPFIFAIE